MAPQSASAYYRRAIAYDSLGKYTQALADYKMAGQLNPSAAAKYTALAVADTGRLQRTVSGRTASNEFAGSAHLAKPEAAAFLMQPGAPLVPLKPKLSTEKAKTAAITSGTASGVASPAVAPGAMADKRSSLLRRIDGLKSKGTSVKPFMDLFDNIESNARKGSDEQMGKDIAYLDDKLSEQEDLVRQSRLVPLPSPSPPSRRRSSASVASFSDLVSSPAPSNSTSPLSQEKLRSLQERYDALYQRFDVWYQEAQDLPRDSD